MQKFRVFEIKTFPFVPEIVSGVLWDVEFDGIDEREDRIIGYTSSEKMIDRQEIERILTNLKAEGLIDSYEVEEFLLGDRNWNEEWEKNLKVIHIGNVVIRPSFKEYTAKGNELIITIDPKMSFGTGEHESTRLMVQLMGNYIKKGDKVLDVGSGTGVLSILAARYGASEVTGIDNNDWCYVNGVENVKLNEVAGQVKILEAEIYDMEDNEYDVILANINKIVLTDIVEELYRRLKEGGALILSGILKSDTEDIITTYTDAGWKQKENRDMGEWTSFVFIK